MVSSLLSLPGLPTNQIKEVIKMTKVNNEKKYSIELRKRFWEKVDICDCNDCWNWKSGTQSKGYGSFGIGNGKTALSHRVAYELTYGEIPDGLCVCYQCDNKLCCNPNHLFLDTIAGNNKDMVKKGRQAIGMKNGRAILNNEMAVTMRSDYKFEGKSIKEIAEEYDIHYNTARNAIHCKTWKD